MAPSPSWPAWAWSPATCTTPRWTGAARREFGAFVGRLDAAYPVAAPWSLVLDGHSARCSRVSRGMRACSAGVANRFEFVFARKHASWLPCGTRVALVGEPGERLQRYIDELNAEPAR